MNICGEDIYIIIHYIGWGYLYTGWWYGHRKELESIKFRKKLISNIISNQHTNLLS